ncbi:MAG: hypothetical protein PHP17_00050 [Candidatus Omnitrophica bacterium]|nr:hypothetical protein [Candidatus Omnitrophota bacterium]
MKFFLSLISSLVILQSGAFAYNFIEIDLVKRKVVLDNFCFGKYNINADVGFDFKQEDGSFIVNLEGKDIELLPKEEDDSSIGKRQIAYLSAKLVKKDNLLFVNYLRSPQLLARGKIDLDKNELLLDVDCSWREDSSLIEGDIEGKLKIWGKIDDFLVNGSLNIKNGKYQDVDFSRLFFHFMGKPPLFNLSDSEIVLLDGSVYRIEGVMNLRDFSNILPKAEFISKKVNLAGWELLSEEKSSVGLKKNVSDNFDILLNTYDKGNESMNPGAEVRYKIEGNQFLRLRMDDDNTAMIGFERRKEF